MAKNPRQNRYGLKNSQIMMLVITFAFVCGVFFFPGKVMFEQHPQDTRAADHCTAANPHLADAK